MLFAWRLLCSSFVVTTRGPLIRFAFNSPSLLTQEVQRRHKSLQPRHQYMCSGVLCRILPQLSSFISAWVKPPPSPVSAATCALRVPAPGRAPPRETKSSNSQTSPTSRRCVRAARPSHHQGAPLLHDAGTIFRDIGLHFLTISSCDWHHISSAVECDSETWV